MAQVGMSPYQDFHVCVTIAKPFALGASVPVSLLWGLGRGDKALGCCVCHYLSLILGLLSILVVGPFLIFRC